MISIRNNILTLLAIPFMLLNVAYVAVASEVTGTLSSDGSDEAQQGSVQSDVQAESISSDGQVLVQSGGQIQGSVVEGREEGSAMLSDPASWSASTWFTLAALITVAMIAFFLWRHAAS